MGFLQAQPSATSDFFQMLLEQAHWYAIAFLVVRVALDIADIIRAWRHPNRSLERKQVLTAIAGFDILLMTPAYLLYVMGIFPHICGTMFVIGTFVALIHLGGKLNKASTRYKEVCRHRLKRAILKNENKRLRSSMALGLEVAGAILVVVWFMIPGSNNGAALGFIGWIVLKIANAIWASRSKVAMKKEQCYLPLDPVLEYAVKPQPAHRRSPSVLAGIFDDLTGRESVVSSSPSRSSFTSPPVVVSNPAGLQSAAVPGRGPQPHRRSATASQVGLR